MAGGAYDGVVNRKELISMASKRKQGPLAQMGQTVSDAAKTAMNAADEYIVEPVGSLLGLTGKTTKARKRAAKKKTPRKSASRPTTRTAKRPAKRPVKAKPAAKARRAPAAKRPAKAKRK